MNDLQVFQFEGENVRIIDQNGEPWWILKDVCDALTIGNITELTKRLDEDEFSQTEVIDSIGRKQNTIIVNESGLYNVILRSDKPDAKRFSKWVRSEVLPTIRKTGSYALPKGAELVALGLIEATKMIAEKDAKIAEDAPKVEFYDQVVDSDGALSMREAAAILNMPGWGRNTIFEFLRDKGIVDEDNVPYRSYQDKEYFRVILNKWTDAHGETHTGKTTLVYPKGVDYIRKLLKKSNLN
jgi:anti-repressor protein